MCPLYYAITLWVVGRCGDVVDAKSLTEGVFWTCKPALRCRLSKGTFSSGKSQGVGILEWGGNGEGMEMGRSVYEQPGTRVDWILSQQGGFPSK